MSGSIPVPLRSEIFDDVYFCAEDGLAETRHVFLAGNALPDLWVGADQTTLMETGFGTGLNFLAAWALFEETALPWQSLDFISFERYPLTPDQIRSALEHWSQDLGKDRLEAFLCAGARDFEAQRKGGGKVRLRVIVGDVNETLPGFCGERAADAWFLDGFAPARNPDMWTCTLFETMARLSRSGTRFSSFTAAGFVRRGLEAAGFRVEKVPGFGKKRHMIRGVFEG